MLLNYVFIINGFSSFVNNNIKKNKFCYYKQKNANNTLYIQQYSAEF